MTHGLARLCSFCFGIFAGHFQDKGHVLFNTDEGGASDYEMYMFRVVPLQLNGDPPTL